MFGQRIKTPSGSRTRAVLHVSHSHILAGHLVGIVQAGPSHNRASQFHRLQIGHGSDGAAAAHLHANARQGRRGLKLFKLPGDCPARAFGCGPELLLLLKAIHLHHKAIHLKVEPVQFPDQFCAAFDERIERGKEMCLRGHGESGTLGPLKELRLRTCVQAGRLSDTVTKKPQRSLGALPRIEESNAAGGDVASVGKWGITQTGLLLVQRDQTRIGHVDLAANLDRCRRRFHGQSQRHAVNRADVVRDVVAHFAAPASDSAHEHAIFVRQRHSHAVDLEFEQPLNATAV